MLGRGSVYLLGEVYDMGIICEIRAGGGLNLLCIAGRLYCVWRLGVASTTRNFAHYDRLYRRKLH
jgi:hypothetical protein